MGVNHNSYVTAQRGGAAMTGSSAAGGNLTAQKVDTPEFSSHNLSHKVLTTGMPCVLYPIDTMSLVSGDIFDVEGNLTAIFMPTNKPFMDEFEVVAHQYFVPNRLLDPNWEQFFTGGKDGKYKEPRPCLDLYSFKSYIPATPNTPVRLARHLAFDKGGLLDLFNMPCRDSLSSQLASANESNFVSTDKFMAYQRIYNDFYRLPELECDYFLPIPETPSETASHFITDLLKYMYDRNRLHPASFWTSEIGTTATTNRNSLFEYAVDYVNSHDGLFWNFYEWLCKRPKIFNSSDVLHYATSVSTSGVVNYDSSQYQIVCTLDDNSHDGLKPIYNIMSGISEIGEPATAPTGQSYYASIEALDTTAIAGTQFQYENGPMTELVNAAIAYAIKAWIFCLTQPRFMHVERDRYNIALPYTMRGRGAVLLKNIVAEGSFTSSSLVSGSAISPEEMFGTYGDTLMSLYGVKTSVGGKTLKTGFSENDLRNLRAATSFLEKSAKFGYRYSEYIRGLFGVTSDIDDYNRAHYLGGLKQTINATRVTNMAGTPDENNNVAIGQWSGEAGCNVSGKLGHWESCENGYIMTLVCVKPRLLYMNINDPENCKLVDRSQYFMPDFAYIQEQPQTIDELQSGSAAKFCAHLNGFESDSPTIVGNVPRYNEYRSLPSTVHGDLTLYDDMKAFTVAVDYDHRSNLTLSDLQTNIPTSENIQRLFQVDVVEQSPIIFEFGLGVDAKRLVPAFTPTL